MDIKRPATGHINPFGLRLQPELREALEASCRESGRSMNTEITMRLEQSYVPPSSPETIDHLMRYMAAYHTASNARTRLNTLLLMSRKVPSPLWEPEIRDAQADVADTELRLRDVGGPNAPPRRSSAEMLAGPLDPGGGMPRRPVSSSAEQLARPIVPQPPSNEIKRPVPQPPTQGGAIRRPVPKKP